jgi:uncharacterized protein YbjT (DUF2867 family)
MAAEIGTKNTIGQLHRQEESIIDESGIPYTFLRPSVVSLDTAAHFIVSYSKFLVIMTTALLANNFADFTFCKWYVCKCVKVYSLS